MNNFNNSFPLSAPHTMSHGYSQQNGLSNLVTIPPTSQNITIPPTLPNIENPMFNIRNNGGGVAVSNTSESGLGRPRGSRNKPRGENSTMMTIILNVPPNVDLIDWVVRYANSKKVHLTILCGSGDVLQADLSHMGSRAPPQTYIEQLNLITFSGIFLFSSSADGPRAFFNVTLGRPNGDIVSGTALKMITMNNVALTASIFHNPEILTVQATEQINIESNYHRLSGRNLKWTVVLCYEPGTDIIKGLVQFAWYYSLKVSVVCCSGLVSDVDIGYSRSHPPSVNAWGNFQIISFSGNFDAHGATCFDNIHKSFHVSMVSQNNVLTNGVVVNRMKAASYVTVVVLVKDAL